MGKIGIKLALEENIKYNLFVDIAVSNTQERKKEKPLILIDRWFFCFYLN